jgi:hypothetical protein
LVFLLQTMPGATALATTGIATLLKAASRLRCRIVDRWGVLTAGLLFGLGIPLSMSMASGGGYLSWFRTDQRFPPLSAIGGGDRDPDGVPLAFDDSTLWFDAAGMPHPRPACPGRTCATFASRQGRDRWCGCGGRRRRPHHRAQGRPDHVRAWGEHGVRVGAGQRSPLDVATALAGALAGVKAGAIEDGRSRTSPTRSFAEPRLRPARPRSGALTPGATPVSTTKEKAFELRRAAIGGGRHGRSRWRRPAGADAVRIVPSGGLGDADASHLARPPTSPSCSHSAPPSLAPIDPTTTARRSAPRSRLPEFSDSGTSTSGASTSGGCS